MTKSSVLDIIKRLKEKKIDVSIYEPEITSTKYMSVQFERDINVFKNECDLIIANRTTSELSDVINKIFTRDIFHEN